MKQLNLVEHQDKVVLQEDVDALIQVGDTLPTASSIVVGKYYFLRKAHEVTVTQTEETYTELLQPGLIYKGVSYTHVIPSSGIKETCYKWELASFKEGGALAAPKMDDPVKTGDTVIITWTDPVDVIDKLDASKSAVWEYSVIVRKYGSTAPTSVDDGTIIGYSSVRNQYQTSGFIDRVLDVDGLEVQYNVFAVTRYGVATGTGGGGGSELNWAKLRELIRTGKAGTVLSIGDCITVQHAKFGELQMQVVAISSPSASYATLSNVYALSYDTQKLSTKSYYIKSGDTYTLVTTTGNPKENGWYEKLTHSVTLMSYNTLFKAVYDTKESGDPGYISAVSELNKCSARGRATWLYSNLRQWLNSISNSESWYVQPSGNTYDMPPDDSTAQYKLAGELLPGFLSGFEASSNPDTDPKFRDLLVPVNTTTITDPFIYNHASEDQRSIVSSDYVYIPSYYELYGRQVSGMEAFDTYGIYEGRLLPYFDATNTDVVLTDDDGNTIERSRLKLDLNGNISGYYLRTVETTQGTSGGAYSMSSPSGVWAMSTNGVYTELPPLSAGTANTVGCHQVKDTTASEAGVAFMMVIA